MLFFVIITLLCSCSIFQKRHSKNYIEYKVFDSLEFVLAKAIIENQKSTTHFIGFELTIDCHNILPGSIQTYYISLVYDDFEGQKKVIEVLKKSNRVLLIDGKRYPIYLTGFDGIFLPRNDFYKNKKRNDEIPDHWEPFIKTFSVDMARKVIY